MLFRAALDGMYGEYVRGVRNYSTFDSDYVECEYKYYGARKRSEDCMDYILLDTYY